MSGPWTSSELEELRANHDLPDKVVAAMLGRTPNAVMKKRHELGLKKYRVERWTPEQDDELARMAADGMCAREIGEAMGRTRVSVQCEARKLGVLVEPERRRAGSARREWCRDDEVALRECAASGWCLADISAEMGLGYRYVAYKARELGIEIRPGRKER